MDPSQQAAILRAIAISAIDIPGISSQDRIDAFHVLQELKNFANRVPLALQWLQTDMHRLEPYDITTPTHMLALDVIKDFVQKGYSSLPQPEQQQLRQAVWQAALRLAPRPDRETRILSRKIAALLEDLMIRDFPQRWPTLMNEMLVPPSAGGLWCPPETGVRMVLEIFRLVAEDCTDADFNSKISTKRRNDVLIGLNETSKDFLPLLFRLLEHVQVLQQSKATLFQMHTYLVQNGRTVQSLSPDERTQYEEQIRVRDDTSQLLSDTLVTLYAFCCSMPASWMWEHEFVGAFLHMMRLPDQQVKAVECLEMLSRSKPDSKQWLRLISEIPGAVQEASQVFQQEMEQLKAEEEAKGGSFDEDALSLQHDFHRALSRMLATVLSSNLAHMTTNQSVLKMNGPVFDQLCTFLRLMVDMLQHPSGRICSEQLNSWTAILRDPQVARIRLLRPYVEQILTCYMDKFARVRWEDVENGDIPNAALLEAAFDDEDGYDAWMCDLRSRCSQLFKFIGNQEPAIAADVLRNRLRNLLLAHGNGEPGDHVDPSNNQLTQQSDAVIQFEGFYQPLDNTLHGIPKWSLLQDASAPKERTAEKAQVLKTTSEALSELSDALVAWNPRPVWLKFRRATLLEALKHYWQYGLSPSALLSGVDSLLKYLGLPDEWTPNSQGKLSDEMTGLKKKSGVTLVSVSKKVPTQLVDWLPQLSEATRGLLSSQGMIPMNQMHLYEFLSCVATAVQDPSVRSNFIREVLSSDLELLESNEVQQYIATPVSLMQALGIAQASGRPESVTDIQHVRQISSQYNRLFVSLNRLLSVGKRCNEAARKKTANGGVPLTSLPKNGTTDEASNLLNFPDEGPLSLQDLAINDPFVPLWPRILPTLLTVFESLLSIWRPENQAVLLKNRLQRYALAISDDEAFISKNQDAKGGGVFGEGGTAGSVVAGADRRDANLVPKWSGWLNEMRNTCFQMLGLLCTQRVLFSPEISPLYPRLVSVLSNQANLRGMEHRHFTQYLKQVVELLFISCPASMYHTHLEPIVGPTFDHLRYRLEKTWAPIIGGDQSTAPMQENMTKALTSSDAAAAADIASRGNDGWFEWYYAHAGLFVGDLDHVTSEAVVDKNRVDLSRVFGDTLQVALALKGDWALVLANRAKENHAAIRNDASRLFAGPKNRINDDTVPLNADGTPRSEYQDAIDARKLLRINRLCHFLLLENESLAGNVTLSITQCLGYPDAYTCRRMAKICHRMLETVAIYPQYSDLLGRILFTQAVKNIVTEPKWMVGVEWDMISVVRDIYGRLSLGQWFQPSGQGAGQQQAQIGPHVFEQSKSANEPLDGGGILTTPSSVPRQVLASLPGVTESDIEEFERGLKEKRAAKDQKDYIRDILRSAADAIKLQDTSNHQGAAAGIFDRALQEESLLHSNVIKPVIQDLPEKLVTQSQVAKRNQREDEPEGLATTIF